MKIKITMNNNDQYIISSNINEFIERCNKDLFIDIGEYEQYYIQVSAVVSIEVI